MLNLFPQGKDDILTMNEKAMLSKRKKKKEKKLVPLERHF